MKQHPSIEKTARRDSVGTALRDWKAAALFTGITAVFFYKILLGEAWLWEDMMFFSYPVRVYAATTMAMGHVPLWNPYTFSGMPFLADIQTTVFYLPCVALALFVRNGGLSFYWLELMVIAHYALAGWAMYLLASSYDLKRVPALFAGVSYMLSGFMVTHAIHQQIITMVAWFPLIIMLFRTALTRTGWRPAFLCALLLGHSTFAGYPQLSLYFHSFLFAYFVFLLLSAYRGKSLVSRPALIVAAKAGLIVGLGLAVAAIQLLPTAELAGLSQRAQITYGKSTEGSLAWSQLLTFFIPKLFGAAGATGSTYWGPGTYWYLLGDMRLYRDPAVDARRGVRPVRPQEPACGVLLGGGAVRTPVCTGEQFRSPQARPGCDPGILHVPQSRACGRVFLACREPPRGIRAAGRHELR